MNNKIRHTEVIEAAGGILWRKTPHKIEICIVHRPKYDDWGFPKGKRDPGEKWHETAQREVYEETGCQAQIKNFAGCISYPIGEAIKLVLFWNMYVVSNIAFTPNSEIDQIRWLSPHEAVNWLSYEKEKNILLKQLFLT